MTQNHGDSVPRHLGVTRLDSMAANEPREPSLRRPPPEHTPSRHGRSTQLPKKRALAMLLILLINEYVRHENYVDQWSHTRQKERAERWVLREQNAAERATAADKYYGRHRLRLSAPTIPDDSGDIAHGAQLGLMTSSNNPPIVSPPARAFAWGLKGAQRHSQRCPIVACPLEACRITHDPLAAGEPLPWASSTVRLHFWFLCWRQWIKR